MIPIRIAILLLLATSATAATLRPSSPRQYHELTINFEGPSTNERATPNPFRDFRLDVVFTHMASHANTVVVPGFYAADGHAADTAATSGNTWAVRFTPSHTGTWRYAASFHTGPLIAVAAPACVATVGTSTAFHGETATFHVLGTEAQLPDLRARGHLRYVARRYLRFEDGAYFMKTGTNSPENLLSFVDFDGNGSRLAFASHVRDWRRGDPTWGPRHRGKGLVGALNYLARAGVNSVFAMLMTVRGDSAGQVHPWVSQEERTVYDVSKLEQWNLVFGHAQTQGLCLNLVLAETENEALFETDENRSTTTGFAESRKLFYREMVARFAHHLCLTFTLAEENGWSETARHGGGFAWGAGNTHAQRGLFTTHIRELDAYAKPMLIHTYPEMKEVVYAPMLGAAAGMYVEGASLQVSKKHQTYQQTAEWMRRSTWAGKPWVVTTDEIGADQPGMHAGIPPNSERRKDWKYRGLLCWANALAGGAGVEVFSAPLDLSLQDFRQFALTWAEFSRVPTFFQRFHIPFWDMWTLTQSTTMQQLRWTDGVQYTFGIDGLMYVIYQSAEVETLLNLTSFPHEFHVHWFAVRAFASLDLSNGTIPSVTGGGVVNIGRPPSNWNSDWVALVEKKGYSNRTVKAIE